MITISNLAATAALIGDPARASMLFALMDGRAFTAGELARTAGVAAPTASGHLSKLMDAGLLAVESQGRHRYFRLASTEVAAGLEGLLGLAAYRNGHEGTQAPRVGPQDREMRRARVCYDHLAGELGVALFRAMTERDQLRITSDGAALTGAGETLLRELGALPHEGRAPLCRPCLDWSERRHHLAGKAGAVLCRTALDRDWVRRMEDTRAVRITPAGAAAFKSHFGVELD